MAGPGPWSNPGAVSLVIIDSSAGFTGLFVYSPAPGAGNLVGSISNSSGHDPYGNTIVPGFTTYVAGTPYVAVNMASGELNFLTASSGTSAFLIQAGLELQTSSNDLQIFANGNNVNVSGTSLVAVDGAPGDPSIVSTDSANSLGSLGASGISIGEATYYLLPIGPGGANMAFISIKGSTTGSGPTAGSTTFPVTLPAAYRPATSTNTQLPVATSPNVAGFFVTVGTGGGVALHYPTTGSGTNFSCQGLYDLQ